MGSEHRHKHSTRMVRPADDSDSDSESDVAEKPVHSVRKLPYPKPAKSMTPKSLKGANLRVITLTRWTTA